MSAQGQQSLVDRLDRLRQWREDNDPTWDGLEPGLSADEIDELTETLRPLRLPEELYTLYQWRDGQAGDGELLEFPFLPLKYAMKQYKMVAKLFEGWNPLWFPFCDMQGDGLLVELADPQQPSSPVYLSYNEEPELCLHCNDVAGLVEATLASLEKSAFTLQDGACWVRNGGKADPIRLASNPGAYALGQSEVRGENIFTKNGTHDWPARWKRRVHLPRAPSAKPMSISAFQSGARSRTVERARLSGRVVGLAGNDKRCTYDLSDDEVDIRVFCADTPSIREVVIGSRVEMEVEARPSGSGSHAADYTATTIQVLELPDENRPLVQEHAEQDKKAAVMLMRDPKGAYRIWHDPAPGGFSTPSIYGMCTTAEDALTACRRWVEGDLRFLLAEIGTDSGAAALLELYRTLSTMSYPRIESPDPDCTFSALAYAESRAPEICAQYAR